MFLFQGGVLTWELLYKLQQDVLSSILYTVNMCCFHNIIGLYTTMKCTKSTLFYC